MLDVYIYFFYFPFPPLLPFCSLRPLYPLLRVLLHLLSLLHLHLHLLSLLPSQMVSAFYHKKRIPSFTDRILYKSMPAFASNVNNLFFESCEQAVSSDHKPVRAGFELAIGKGDRGIAVDKQLLAWKGKVSKKTSGARSDVHMLKLVLR
jgi:hypothetical protein